MYFSPFFLSKKHFLANFVSIVYFTCVLRSLYLSLSLHSHSPSLFICFVTILNNRFPMRFQIRAYFFFVFIFGHRKRRQKCPLAAATTGTTTATATSTATATATNGQTDVTYKKVAVSISISVSVSVSIIFAFFDTVVCFTFQATKATKHTDTQYLSATVEHNTTTTTTASAAVAAASAAATTHSVLRVDHFAVKLHLYIYKYFI